MKTLWGYDFIEAYGKAQRIRFKFDKNSTPDERKEVDVEGTTLERQAGFLFGWLAKNGYIKPGKYKVGFACSVCGEHLNIKKWKGGTLNVKEHEGNLVCDKCAALFDQIKKTGKARKSKRLMRMKKMGLVKFEKRSKKAARPD